jgi:hypothetical protein
MAHKCTSPGCEFSLPDSYPLPKCPWHTVPGRGAVKIARRQSINTKPDRRFFIHNPPASLMHHKRLMIDEREDLAKLQAIGQKLATDLRPLIKIDGKTERLPSR